MEESVVEQIGTGCMQRLTNLGQTRWRAKHNAAVKIFGSFNAATDETCSFACLYPALVFNVWIKLPTHYVFLASSDLKPKHFATIF